MSTNYRCTKNDSSNIRSLVSEFKSVIRSNLGKYASEDDIRNLFENGYLDIWIEADACTQEEAEEALEYAIEYFMEYMK